MMVVFSGCGPRGDSPEQAVVGAVAVIDLDLIARHLGRDSEIAASLNQRQASLNQQLVNLEKSYKQQIAQHQTALSKDPAGSASQSISVWQRSANANLNKAKRQMGSDLLQHRQALIDRFRHELKPVARKVAQARGLSIIVTKNDSVIYDYSAAVDITEAVLEELRVGDAAQGLQTPHHVAARPGQQQATAAHTTR